MANDTRVVTVEGFGDYNVGAGLSDAEILRNLSMLTGAPWVQSARICTDSNGRKTVQRPAAGSKG